MIEKLYGKYFQKSKSFLYPALGIKRNTRFNVKNTYLAIEGLISIEDLKLICTFNNQDGDGFKDFEEAMLLTNPLFDKKIVSDSKTYYVFDLQIYGNDWTNFILGKYSKFSTTLKKAIKTYFGENSGEYKYLETYLFPEKFFEQYAKLLDMDVSTLKQIGQLCDPYDTDKETLNISKENLEISEQSV